MPSAKEEIRTAVLDAGFTTVGFAAATPPETMPAYREWLSAGRHAGMTYLETSADLRSDPRTLLTGARTVVMATLNYAQDPPTDDPRIARYALGRDYHRVIRSRLGAVVRALSPRYPSESWRVCVDSAPLLEREFAVRAGLGWVGKNTMVIDSRRGSWFFLATLLTTLEIEPDPPAVGGCGTCRACVEACPTGAIVRADGRWQVDARRCVSYLTIEHRGDLPPDADLAGWTFGCDVCQEVCPFNAPRESQPLRAAPTTVPDFAPRPYPPNERLTTLDEAEWDALTVGSAVRRAGWAGLRRNALRVLQQDGGRLAAADAGGGDGAAPTQAAEFVGGGQ